MSHSSKHLSKGVGSNCSFHCNMELTCTMSLKFHCGTYDFQVLSLGF